MVSRRQMIIFVKWKSTLLFGPNAWEYETSPLSKRIYR